MNKFIGWGEVVGMIAIQGTTDAFGLNDLQGMVMLWNELVQRFFSVLLFPYSCGCINWMGMVRLDRLSFWSKSVRVPSSDCAGFGWGLQKNRHLFRADSIGINFHKPGFVPYISSLILVQHKEDPDLLQR